MPDPTLAAQGEGQQAPPAAEQQQTPPPATDNGTGTNAGNEGDAPKLFSQAELEAKLKERLDRERKNAETAAQKAKDEAAAQRLKEQAAWETLATQNEAKVKELQPAVETLTAERDALTAIVTAAIDSETRDWAKEVKDLLPAEASVLEKYAAVERTRGLAARLAAAPPPPGNGPMPKPAGGAAGEQAGKDRVMHFVRGRA